MNVYDFDKTIFRHDSTYHFYLFCLRRYPRVWRYLPSLAWAAVLFFLDVIPKTEFKERFYRFLQEPKRMFKRYFVDDMKIIGLIKKYR